MPIGYFNSSARRRSASQQTLALQGSPQTSGSVSEQNTRPNPALFGRPGFTYVQVVSTPQSGPLPRLAQGSGRTGKATDRSQGHIPGGYLAENDYQPDSYSYMPEQRDDFHKEVPKSVGEGNDGREIVGTYNPHDFQMAAYQQNQWRSSANWQNITNGPSWRNLLIWQQVRSYNLYTQIAQARPLSQNDYFVGYQTSLDTMTGAQ